MGHITNATGFRLTKTTRYKAIFVNPLNNRYRELLQKNIYIFKFLKIFFMQYSVYINEKLRQVIKTNVNENFNKKTFGNYFITEGFTFSHCIISRGKYMHIYVNLFDSKLEILRANANHFIKTIPITFFKKKQLKWKRATTLLLFGALSKFIVLREGQTLKRARNWRYLMSKYTGRRLKRKQTRIFAARKDSKIKKTLLFRSLIKLLKKIHSRITSKKQKGKKIRKIRKIRKMYFRTNIRKKWWWKNYPIKLPWQLRKKRLNKKAKIKYYGKHNAIKLLGLFPLINKVRLDYAHNLPFIRVKNRFKLLKVFIRLFQQNIQQKKNAFFFLITFRALLLSLLSLPLFKPNFLFWKCILLLRIKEYSFNHLNMFFFKNIFKKRFRLYRCAFLLINASVQAIEKVKNNKISFSSYHTRNISAAHLCNYITIKLGQYFRINEILYPVIKLLKNTNGLEGFRILIVGRLNRRERAAHMIRSKGSIPLSTKNKFIDYAADFKIMRFGMVGIKIWIHRKMSRPYFYTFHFFV